MLLHMECPFKIISAALKCQLRITSTRLDAHNPTSNYPNQNFTK